MSADAGAPSQRVLMLLDTYGLVYRAFFALPMLTTSKGTPINAVYGFTQMLARVLDDERPTHVIAAFDKGLPHRRTEAFAEYKAQREAMPDDLRSQFPLVRRVLETYGVPIIEIEGEEADDVIATLARNAQQEGVRVDVVTGDLDLLQIVDERTTVLATRRGITELQRYGPEAVRERFSLEPSQLPDYRGLKGDPSDNLPGIPGIGEKSAIKILKNAGSLDALLSDPSLAGSPKHEKLVREHAAAARVCRDVSLVSRDLPISVPWEQARFEAPSSEKLIPLYRELEFKTLLAKAVDASPSLFAGERALEGAYTAPEGDELATLLRQAAGAASVAICASNGRIGVSTQAGAGFSFPLDQLSNQRVREAAAPLLETKAPLTTHDAKNVLATLRPYGLRREAFADDTMILAHLLNPARSYQRLGDAVSEYLEHSLPDNAAAWADAASRLAPVLRERLNERGQMRLYGDVELPLAVLLASMEEAGIAVDRTELEIVKREVESSIARLQSEIHAMAGETFNIASPQQLGAILFERLGIPGGTRNKTGWATGAEVLQPLARAYPICAKILEYREVTKLENTYIDVLPKLVDAAGRIHTVFNQTSTATGRISSVNPNLQNIPVRSELGRRIRRAFVAPSPSHLLLAADYSQIELRIIAHLSGDAQMREAFIRGADIHDVTAHGIFHLAPEEKATPNQRRIAKSVNFGLLYGMSDFGLAQRLEIGREQAHAMIEAYFARFPSVRSYIHQTLESARERGYVETILGRRRYFPDLRSHNHALRSAAEREATNAPMQGSAADLMKLAMLRIDRALRKEKLDARLLLQIHDEVILEAERSRIEEIARLVKGEMEHAFELSVPLEASVKIGSSWYDIQSMEFSALPGMENGA